MATNICRSLEREVKDPDLVSKISLKFFSSICFKLDRIHTNNCVSFLFCLRCCFGPVTADSYTLNRCIISTLTTVHKQTGGTNDYCSADPYFLQAKFDFQVI